MLCPPTLRPASPAESEISVGGAPSPLPHHRGTIELLQQHHHHLLMNHHAGLNRSIGGGDEFFQPFKRLRMSSETGVRDRSTSPPTTPAVPQKLSPPSVPNAASASAITKSNIEGVKSFSIADILGHEKSPPRPTAVGSGSFQHRSEPLEVVTTGVPHGAHPASAILLPTTQIVRPWDHLLGPIPVRPFIPPALLHYEQRLALDYHRQIQEHFNAQAQLLRHMGMDIIPSESGSERSSSAASDCCSPEIAANRMSTESAASGHPNHAQSHHSRHSPQSNTTSQTSSASAGSTASSGGPVAANAISSGKTKPNGTPLDALFQMTTKDFDESQDKSHIDLFSNRPQPKKKRKSRTAFTNHQIFELERRFSTQKYLAPSDRDELAGALGLSNAQVITWFQNRRAKQKRDIEELKKDYDTVTAFSAHKSFLENVNELSILKKKSMHDGGLDMYGIGSGVGVGVGGCPSNNSNSNSVTHTLSPQK